METHPEKVLVLYIAKKIIQVACSICFNNAKNAHM